MHKGPDHVFCGISFDERCTRCTNNMSCLSKEKLLKKLKRKFSGIRWKQTQSYLITCVHGLQEVIMGSCFSNY